MRRSRIATVQSVAEVVPASTSGMTTARRATCGVASADARRVGRSQLIGQVSRLGMLAPIDRDATMAEPEEREMKRLLMYVLLAAAVVAPSAAWAAEAACACCPDCPVGCPCCP